MLYMYYFSETSSSLKQVFTSPFYKQEADPEREGILFSQQLNPGQAVFKAHTMVSLLPSHSLFWECFLNPLDTMQDTKYR